MNPTALRPELPGASSGKPRPCAPASPDGSQLALEPDGSPAWHGAVPVEGWEFPVVVRYPPAYPAMSPVLETTLPLPLGCPHVLDHRAGRYRQRHGRRRGGRGRT